jgi:hypothetical protein
MTTGSGQTKRRIPGVIAPVLAAAVLWLGLPAMLQAGASDPPAAPQGAAAAPAYLAALDKPVLEKANANLPGWLKLSGEVRFRYESRQGLGFREGNDDSYGLVRTRLNIDIQPMPWLQFFVQGQDARAPGINDSSATGLYRDPFDLRQAYVRFRAGERRTVAVTVGRQLLNYGDQRLIGPLDWTNTSRAFDAVKLELQPHENVKLDVFSASVVENDPNRRVNVSPEGNNLHGFYGAIRKVIPKSTIEPYLLWKTTPFVSSELGRAGDLDRYTGGVRIWGKELGRWDYNLAVARQWGDSAGNRIRALGAYAEVGYTLPLPWTPRAYAEYTYGSGDADPNDGRVGGFDDLYPTAHLWYGYSDLVGWRNLKNARLGLQVSPHRKLKAAVDYHSFWLASRRDGLYNVAGRLAVAAPVEGAADTKIGDEVDVTFTVPLTPMVALGGGFGHLFPGPFLEANSPGHGNTFSFVFVAYKF